MNDAQGDGQVDGSTDRMIDGIIISRAQARTDRGTGTHGGGTGASDVAAALQVSMKGNNGGDGESAAEEEALHDERLFNMDPVRRQVCPGAALCWGMCVNLFALGQYDKSSSI